MDYAVVLSGTGRYVPPHKVTNEALVESFNEYIRRFNHQHEKEIAAGTVTAGLLSSCEFIEKASGIKNRYVVDTKGLLNPDRMRPLIESRPDEAMSLQCEMALKAAWDALDDAQLEPKDIDFVLVSCSTMQRAYPGISIELQAALGITGYAFDMSVACSSATFGLETARQHIRTGQAKRVLMVNPEICTAHLDFKSRDCHFIFGDVCTAVILERASLSVRPKFILRSTALKTHFSNNIRNNSGFINFSERSEHDAEGPYMQLFKQNGRKVFKEVVPMASEHILQHLKTTNIQIEEVKRLWLHQANLNMNQLIAKKVLGREPTQSDSPCILDEYGNTASAGSILAFHHHHQDLKAGDLGMICSFGAGYSIGSVLVEKL